MDFTNKELFNNEPDFTIRRKYKRTGLEIVGYHGCPCHAFETIEELKKAERQKFKPGDYIISRCGGSRGIVTRIEDGYVYVTTGPIPRDQVFFHKTKIYLNPIQQ